MSDDKPFDDDALVDFVRTELDKSPPSTRRKLLEKFALAALGSIPWVGGFISAAASVKLDANALRTDSLQTRWLAEHAEKLARLQKTLNEISERFESLGEEIDERLRSEEYLDLVRKTFRVWDRADTDEKRTYAANLVANASGTRLCSDDVVRLFIDWLDLYHESHFAVIRQIYSNPGITRHQIWLNLYGDFPRDDSAEADLYKLLIRDLTIGGVIRQPRETNDEGQYVRKRPGRPRGSGRAPRTLESPFEDTKPHVLTELGKQFVHYTIEEVVQRVESGRS